MVGTVHAFSPGDKEQGRGTLHSHWRVFIKELTNEVHSALFEGNNADKEEAKQKITHHIDQVMKSSHGDNIIVKHMCKELKPIVGRVGDIFQQCPLQTLRNARHKNMCNDVRGEIIECKE